MYSGELESQIKRKMLAVLQDETSKLLNAGRDLSLAYESINNSKVLLDKFRAHCERIDEINRKVTREISEMGNMLLNREELLRALYLLSNIVGGLDGIAFRVATLRLTNDSKNGKIYEFIDMIVESLSKLNEITRAMSINTQSVIELVSEVQNIEKEADSKYRELLLYVMNNTTDFKELLLLKDALDGIESVADRCLDAARSFEVITLNI
ncbi:MAG: DUF47 family protein [Candidatus Nitrosocaldaceae archaeon]